MEKNWPQNRSPSVVFSRMSYGFPPPDCVQIWTTSTTAARSAYAPSNRLDYCMYATIGQAQFADSFKRGLRRSPAWSLDPKHPRPHTENRQLGIHSSADGDRSAGSRLQADTTPIPISLWISRSDARGGKVGVIPAAPQIPAAPAALYLIRIDTVTFRASAMRQTTATSSCMFLTSAPIYRSPPPTDKF